MDGRNSIEELLPNVEIDGDTVDAAHCINSLEDAVRLHALLKDTKEYTRINLTSSKLSDNAVVEVCALLVDNSSFHVFDISSVSISKEGLRTVAEAVSMSHIETLIMDKTGFTEECVEAMSPLAESQFLSTISMRDNHLTDSGFHHFLYYIQQVETLHSIDVANNDISGAILPILADFLENCSSIQRIDISGMPMTPEKGSAFNKLSELAECDIFVTHSDNTAENERKLMHQHASLVLSALADYGVASGRGAEVVREVVRGAANEEEGKTKLEWLEFPSELSKEVRSVALFLQRSQKQGGDAELLHLLEDNLELLVQLLGVSPTLAFASPSYTVQVPSRIRITVGRVERYGQLRVQLVALFATLAATQDEHVLELFAEKEMNITLINALLLFPWNSALHAHVVEYFAHMLESAPIYVENLFKKDKIHDIVFTALSGAVMMKNTLNKEYVGYNGALIQICQLMVGALSKNEALRKEIDSDHSYSTFLSQVLEPLLKDQESVVSIHSVGESANW